MKLNTKFLLNMILTILFIIVVFYTFFSNVQFNNDNSFEYIYSTVDEIYNQKPKRANVDQGGLLFYKPKGYKFLGETLIMERNDEYIEVFSKKISNDSDFYNINSDKELLYERTNEYKEDEPKKIELKIWEDQDRYEVLIINDKNYAVGGNLSKENLNESVIDMSYIIGSMELKEQDDTEQFL